MFKKTVAIFSADVKSLCRVSTLLALLAPAVIAVIFAASLPPGILNGYALKPFKMALVCDEPAAGALIKTSMASMDLIEELIECDAGEARRLIDSDGIAAAVVIPTGIIDALVYKQQMQIEVWPNRNRQVEAAVLTSLVDAVAHAVNAAQGAVYSFEDTARGLYSSDGEYYKACEAFARGLVLETLRRGRYVTSFRSGYDYVVQFFFILVFMTVSAVAAFMAAYTAGQISSGTYNRMRVSGARFGYFAASKLAVNFIAALIALAILRGTAFFTEIPAGLDFTRLAVCGVISSLYVFALCFIIACLCGNVQQTALASFAAAFFLLLLGGGIYPLHLMGLLGGIGAFSPAACTLNMTLWSFGRAGFPKEAIYWLLIMLLLTFCILPFGISQLRGGRRGC